MLENTATPLALRKRNRSGLSGMPTSLANNQNNLIDRQLFTSDSPYVTSKNDGKQFGQNQDFKNFLNKFDGKQIKEQYNAQPARFYLQEEMNKENRFLNPTGNQNKQRVTFQDEKFQVPKEYKSYSIEDNIFNVTPTHTKQNSTPSTVKTHKSQQEVLREFSRKLERNTQNSGVYQNKELFHESLENAYIASHQPLSEQQKEYKEFQENFSLEQSDVLTASKATITNQNFLLQLRQIMISASFLSVFLIFGYIYFDFPLQKLIKLLVLLTSVFALRTFTASCNHFTPIFIEIYYFLSQERFEASTGGQTLSSFSLLGIVATMEFFSLAAFATELFVVLLPSHLNLQVFWVGPSLLIAAINTFIFYKRVPCLSDEFMSSECHIFQVIKKAVVQWQMLKESVLTYISSTIMILIIYYLKEYQEQIFLSKYTFTKSEEQQLLTYTNQDSLQLMEYILNISYLSCIVQSIISLSTSLNLLLQKYYVHTYFTNHVCFQPLYSIIFKYDSLFSLYTQYQAMKYWYAYQTVPLAQAIERTQYSSHLTQSEHFAIDSIFEWVSKEMNMILMNLGGIDRDNADNSKKAASLRQYNMKLMIKKQRLLQIILKYILMVISTSAKVFNSKIIDFLQATATSLDQIIQLFEKQTNLFIHEIGIVIQLKKEIVSNLQFMYTKMNHSFKSSHVSSLSLALLANPDHIYNEYDFNSKFII